MKEKNNSSKANFMIALVEKLEANKMLDIISIATLVFLLIGLPLILIIIGGNKSKSEEEIKYLKEYKNTKLNKKNKIWR